MLPAAAAQESDIEASSGWLSPESPLYGLEVAWDNAAVDIGMKKPGSVAQERASEAKKMAETNNTEGIEKAAENMNKVAKKASSEDSEDLQKAESVLQGVISEAPEEAQEGLQKALENVQKAKQREKGNSSETGPAENMSPDEPPVPGEQDNKRPAMTPDEDRSPENNSQTNETPDNAEDDSNPDNQESSPEP